MHFIGKVAKKSILESFKEELKRTQKERVDRHSFNNAPPPDYSPSDIPAVHNTPTEMEVKNESTDLLFDLLESGDSISTNLYVGKCPLAFPNGSLMQTLRIMNNIVLYLCAKFRLTIANSCNI